jgi:hypothetical protein
MGVSAARVLGAIPRALATAVVAVPKQHRPITLTDRSALIQFIKRDIHRLDAERVQTPLGPALATTPEQVERDHLISYLLGFLSERFGDRIRFIGGTALARTPLPNGRLSEDIDLVAVGSRRGVAEELDDALPRAIARTHGRLTLEPLFRAVPDTLPVTARTAEGMSVKIQLLSSRERTVWPAERRLLEQRYNDALPHSLSSRVCRRSPRRKQPLGPIAARRAIFGISGLSLESAQSTRPRWI